MMLLNFILSIITNFGFVVMVLLAIPSIVLYKKNKRIVYSFLAAFFVSSALALLIKLIALKQRPIPVSYPILSALNYSFPSMHSMVAFALFPFLAIYLPKQRYFWVVFVLLVAFSRIYFGFHFLSDVVFGALFGFAIGCLLLVLHKSGRLWQK